MAKSKTSSLVPSAKGVISEKTAIRAQASQAPQTSVQIAQTPQTSQQTLRSWADNFGVSVDWDPDTEIVTLKSPNNATVSFLTNHGSAFGIGNMNADSYHVINNEQQLLKALNMLQSSPPQKPVANAPEVLFPTYTGTPAADYQLDREAEALNLKRSQTVDDLMLKKLDLENTYGRKRGQFYTQYMDSGLAQNELLAAKGLNGGYAEAVNTRRNVSYDDTLQNLGIMENDDLQSVDSAISKAYQSTADALYSLETGYVSQLLKAAQKLESFDYSSGVAAATSSARNIMYR